jgi:hypothetical protein
MKRPRGFVTANSTRKNTTMYTKPVMVMQASSKLLWTQEGVNQVNEQKQCSDTSNDEIHGSALPRDAHRCV